MQNFYLFQLTLSLLVQLPKNVGFYFEYYKCASSAQFTALHRSNALAGKCKQPFFDRHMAHFKSPCTKTQFTLKLGSQGLFKKMQQNLIETRAIKTFNFIDIFNELLDTSIDYIRGEGASLDGRYKITNPNIILPRVCFIVSKLLQSLLALRSKQCRIAACSSSSYLYSKSIPNGIESH